MRLLEMHHAKRVGHLGGNLSALDALLVLYQRVLTPGDQFILSKGHAAGALYIALWSVGRLSDEDLETFHEDDTLLSGHPPASGIDDILFAIGSLGHGVSLASGLALSAMISGGDNRVFCLTSDGEWQEGSCWEAAIFAAHHRLNNLTVLVDANRLQGFGTTKEVASMDPIAERFRGFKLDVIEVDGHDQDRLESLLSAPPSPSPRFIVMHTHKGFGVPTMQDRLESHYLPIQDDDYLKALEHMRRF